MRTLQEQDRICARLQRCLGVLTIALVTAFYFLGYRPNQRRERELSLQIAERQQQLREGKSQTRILPDIASEVGRLRARLDRSKKSIPKSQELPQFIRDVTTLSQQASLRKFGYKPGVATRGELVSEMPIMLNFEGDFVNVYSFLRNAEEMPRLRACAR